MPAGRKPYRWTPEVEERLINALRAGNYIETAAAHAGISKVTLYERLKRGARAATGADHDFSQAVEKALADAEVLDVALIARAAKENWKAAAWRLQHRFPDRWGQKVQAEVTGAGGGPLTVRVVYDDQLQGSDRNPSEAPRGADDGTP
jgi:transposase